MFIDKALQLSSEQAITASAASTNVIDQVKAGDAYVAPWLVATIDESFAGSGTLTIAIQTSDDAEFKTPELLYATGELTASQLSAGTAPVKVRLPQGTKRYIRAYYTASSAFSKGKITLNVVKDVNVHD